MADLVGKQLAHFTIKAKLGEGGMGVVYLATDEKLKRDVALKVLPEALESDPARRNRFLREARSAAAITHACIAAVYEIGDADGHAFIAMELVRGATVRERMAEGLSIAEAVRIARDIARGLAKAHERGIMHRDLKPENVMLTNEGEVKILDFGLAKVWDVDEPGDVGSADTAAQVTRDGQVMGTPAYMSPEQANGEAADARSDVFSFGAMLYEMLTGKRPFVGATHLAVLYAVMNKEPEAVERVNADVPDSLAQVVKRCLMKDRQARFASGSELLAALVTSDADVGPSASNPVTRAATGKVTTVSGMGTALAATITPELIAAEAEAATPPGPLAPQPVAIRSRSGWLSRALVSGVVIVAAVGALGVLRWSRWDHLASTTVAASASASSSPAPVSTRTEAASAYAKGVEELARGDTAAAIGDWKRATSLDSDLCQAHLRLALNVDPTKSVDVEDELKKVQPCRERLSEGDRRLAAVEKLALDPATPATEVSLAAERAADDFPKLAELAVLASDLHNDREGALHWLDRAIEADPSFAPAYWRRASQLRLAGRFDEARLAIDTCLEKQPDSPMCADARFNALAYDGNCKEAETYVRSIITRHPNEAAPFDMLVRLLLGFAAAPEAIERVWRQADSLRPAGDTPSALVKLQRRRELCLVRGDFDCAITALTDQVPLEDARIDAGAKWFAAEMMADSSLEEGQEETARRVVSTFSREVPGYDTTTWPINAFWLHPHQWAFEHGRETLTKLEEARKEMLALQSGLEPFDRWTLASLSTNPSAEEAHVDLLGAPPRNVLEARRATIVDFPARSFRIGVSYLRDGQVDAALPWLEQAVKPCVWTWRAETDAAGYLEIPRVHAFFALGQAREHAGDLAGARAAYEEVVRRWGDAKPRSVTAEKARARLAVIQAKAH